MPEKETDEDALPESPGQSDPNKSAPPKPALNGVDLPAIYRGALHITGDVPAAEDIRQTVSSRMLELSKSKMSGIEKVQAFAWKIARNLAADWWHFRRIPEDSLESLNDPSLYQHDDPTARLDDWHDAMRLLERLPDDQMEVLILHFYQDQSAVEIAKNVSSTANAVRKRIRRALQNLKRMAGEPPQPESQIRRLFKKGKEQK